MCTSFKLNSHVGLKRGARQSLRKHLVGVSNIMVNLIKNKGINNQEFLQVAKTLGLCHDFAKGSEYFQKYLLGLYNGDLKNHGEISAYFAYYMLPSSWKLKGFICVKRHHGNIENLSNEFFKPSDIDSLMKMITSIECNKDELEKIYNADIASFIEMMKSGELFKQVKKEGRKAFSPKGNLSIDDYIESFIDLSIMWSVLLTADKTQIIKGKEFINNDILDGNNIESYKDSLRKKLLIEKPGIEKSELFKIREDVIEEVGDSIKNINLNVDRILSINVPTGTGKTIAGYKAMFDLRTRIRNEKGYISKLIYGINFTSVIDQNYDVLKEIFEFNNIELNSEILLKYHSLTEIEYVDSKDEEFEDYDAKFLVDNWQASIIVTTFVQLFNAIFKCGVNSNTHRLNSLMGSIIILDEVQAISPKFYLILEKVFKVLCEKYNCYVITITATKPKFLVGKELIKSNKEMFEKMNRIRLENYTDKDISIEEFKEVIFKDVEKEKDKSFLFILNTVASAKEIRDFFVENICDRDLYFLSSEILPFERMDIINEIKANKGPKILVSTQLVEAGVDIDFDFVYRDMGPMDCINQSAGRGNRNGIKGKGIVKIYSLVKSDCKFTDNRKYYSGIYNSILLDITREILNKPIFEESEFADLNEKYFKLVKDVSENKGRELLDDLSKYIQNYEFETIRNTFDLIESFDFKEDVIVKYNEEVENCIEIIKTSDKYLEVVNAWIRLNKYRISISESVANKLLNKKEKRSIDRLTIEKYNYEERVGIIEKSTLGF